MEVNDRLTMLNRMRDLLNQRVTAMGYRKKDGTLSKQGREFCLEFLVGAAAAIDGLGLGETHNMTGVAFLASVRGADDFLKG